MKNRTVAVWLQQIRGPFLILAVLLVLVGAAAASAEGLMHGWRTFWSALGVVLAHASVNLFNEHSDFHSGIDSRTVRTPFSGGSGQMQAGATTPGQVWFAAWAALLAALAIGVGLAAVSTWWLLALMIPGGLASRYYTTHLARWGLGEFAAGLCLGSFVVVGGYAVHTGTMPPSIWLISITPGILTGLLLFLNEFPDVEADTYGGRRHLVIALGCRKAAVVYALGVLACYLGIAAPVLLGATPVWILLGFLTLPLAIKSTLGALKHNSNPAALVPALGANVGLVLATDALMALGLWLAA